MMSDGALAARTQQPLAAGSCGRGSAEWGWLLVCLGLVPEGLLGQPHKTPKLAPFQVTVFKFLKSELEIF